MTKLNSLVQQVRTGALELNAQTARDIISEATQDGRLHKSDELEALQDLAAQAPAGSVFGRELIQEFVRGGEGRFRSEQHSRATSPGAIWFDSMKMFNPFLSFFSVPKPSYAHTESGRSRPGNYTRNLADQTEVNATRNVIGQGALEELAMQYDGAAEDVGLTRTRIEIKDDVYQVYLDQVKDQPVNEYDPLGAVQAYLDANYSAVQNP